MTHHPRKKTYSRTKDEFGEVEPIKKNNNTLTFEGQNPSVPQSLLAKEGEEEDFSRPDLVINTRQHGDDLPTYGFFIKEPIYKCEASLRIKTSGEVGHVVKLYDLDDQCTALVYYIPPGATREIDVPTGRYELRYASGTRWFGNLELFGRTGSFAKANEVFVFPRGGGYEITLYAVQNGNLGTHSIDEEDF